MTGQHAATQCKQIISEYGWPETLISDNGPCYKVEAFTNMMKEYGVNHITSSPHYPQSNELAENLSKLSRTCSTRQKEEGKDLFKCLMIYHNTPLTSSLQSPMQILHSRSARPDFPMSNAARKQLSLDPEQLRSKYKNEHLPLCDLHLGQDVMFQDSTRKQSFSSYHYKPVFRTMKLPDSYKGRCHIQKNTSPSEAIQSTKQEEWRWALFITSSNMQTVKSNHMKCNVVNNQAQSYPRPKRDIKPPIKLDL